MKMNMDDYDSQIINKAIKKKLCVLEKFKEEYDLLPPKKYSDVVETQISSQKLTQYEYECGVDYNQLRNILQSFQEEGLIESFNLYNPGR